ncbi:MAG: SDR family oxidoreductase [Myxococcota bacterium]|nr:SDR family oxidoreductase [Myxococcota bacterium]
MFWHLWSMARIFIVGCGYIGEPLGVHLAQQGHEVFGLRREASSLAEEIHPVPGDVSVPDGYRGLPGSVDYIFYMVGAKVRDEDTYRDVYLDGLGRLLQVLGDEGQTPKRIFFTSSTSVYGQTRGEWVDESSPTYPPTFSGSIMAATESVLQASPHPSTVLRLGGIYGPGRQGFVSGLRAGRVFSLPPGVNYTNRIHRDDAVGALAHLLSLESPENLYVGVDDDPADRGEVLHWLADRLLVDVLSEESEVSQRGAGRRCRNDRLRASGYSFLYPSFREGYSALIEDGE